MLFTAISILINRGLFSFKTFLALIIMDSKTFPNEWPKFGGRPFQKVWEKHPEVCEWAMKLDNCTGFLKPFQEFCQRKTKEEECKSTKQETNS